MTRDGIGVRCLLERHFGEAAQLAAVQAIDTFAPQLLERRDADTQVLIDPGPVEMIGHARQLDLPMQRLVAYAQ